MEHISCLMSSEIKTKGVIHTVRKRRSCSRLRSEFSSQWLIGLKRDLAARPMVGPQKQPSRRICKHVAGSVFKVKRANPFDCHRDDAVVERLEVKFSKNHGNIEVDNYAFAIVEVSKFNSTIHEKVDIFDGHQVNC